MKCFTFVLFLQIYYRAVVDGLETPVQFTRDIGNVPQDSGTAIRQGIVQAVDGKDGHHCLEVTDKQCPRTDVTFWLYTREHQNNAHQLDSFNEESLRNAPFVPGAPLKILVHGYTMNKDKAINEVLRPAYFKHYNYNIISVDWSAICPEHCYTQAARSVPTVGYCVAHFLNRLLDMHRDLFSEIHILGHSMGAHVTSWASKDLNLDRLTQFDPALPLFSDVDTDLFIKPVGKYVDVWHSNSALKGRKDVSGTVDIYFNDEMDQPGCNCDTSCSHLRAVEYYGETVSDQHSLPAFQCEGGFQAYRDDKCPVPKREGLVEFGEHFTPGSSGSFLAFTNPQSPFILPMEDYTNEERFKSFEKTHNENCKKNDFAAFFGQLFNL